MILENVTVEKKWAGILNPPDKWIKGAGSQIQEIKAVFVFLHSLYVIVTPFNEFLEPPNQKELQLQPEGWRAQRQAVRIPGQLRVGQHRKTVEQCVCGGGFAQYSRDSFNQTCQQIGNSH